MLPAIAGHPFSARPTLPFTPGKQPSIPVQDQRDVQRWIFRGECTARKVLHEALESHPLTEAWARKFAGCGNDAWVEHDQASGRYRVVAPGCHYRWCPRCGRLLQRRVKDRLRRWTGAGDGGRGAGWKLATFTLRHSGAPLREQLQFLTAAYRRLRQTRLWLGNVDCAAALIQITYNVDADQWHPHLHVLCLSRFIPHERLKRAWSKATRGSTVVDIRKVRSVHACCEYVASYITRPQEWDLESTPAERIREYCMALRGLRMLVVTGRPLPDEPEPEEKAAWIKVQTVHQLLHDARDGSPIAIAIANSLRWEWAEWAEETRPSWRDLVSEDSS